MSKKWNETELQLAVKLNQEGKRFNEIAVVIDKTEKSVKEKLRRVGVKENKVIVFEKTSCLNCGNEIIDLKKNKRKFCSRNCSAIYNNQKFPKRKNINKLSNCLCCGKKLNHSQFKFCSKTCGSNHQKELIFKKIESGNTSLSTRYYKQYLVEKFGKACMKCGWKEINLTSGFIPIQLEHKDGNSENNSLNNLELLCPNCHSLTPTFGILNKGNGRERRRLLRRKNA